MLIGCKVRQWEGRVIYIAILSQTTDVYTVCHISTETDTFTGYSLVDGFTFDATSDVITGYLYSDNGVLAPKAILYRRYNEWRIYVPHLGLSTTFPNKPTDRNVKEFLEGLNAC